MTSVETETGIMDSDGTSSVSGTDHWSSFSAFIQDSYPNDFHQEFTNNAPCLNQRQSENSPSLLLIVGGQETAQILHESGLSLDDIFQFKVILSKVEELCLLKLIRSYEKYKQSVHEIKMPVGFHAFNNSGITDLDKCDSHEISYLDSSLKAEDSVGSQLMQKFHVVSGQSPNILTEIKMEEPSRVCIIKSENSKAQEYCVKVQTNRTSSPTDQGTETHNSNSLSSSVPNIALSNENEYEDKSMVVKVNDKEESSMIRRSSRQIRVSSRYAENKDAIQNLLKPEMPVTNDEVTDLVIKDPPLLCSVCKKTLPDPTSLLSHWKCHKRNKKDKCNLPFLCKDCGSKFATYSWLKVHYKSHMSNEKQDHKRLKSIDKTQNVNNSINSTDASVVGKSDQNNTEKIGENEIISNSKQNSLAEQNKEDFENQKVLCTNENNPKKFKCKKCPEIFEDRKSLLNHCKIHHDQGQNAHLKKEPSLNGQNLVRQNTEKRLYRRIGHFKCKQCTKSFKYERQLDFHMTLHTGEKPHICEVCGHGFRLKRSLLNHTRIHDEMSHIKCEFCPKIFVDRKAFETHQLIHSGVKPFSCEACGKGFRRLIGLQNHQRLHKKDEAIKCDECDKTFVDKWGMLKHKTIHSGEKPFVCMQCGKMFRLKKGLQDHVKLHNKDEQLRCSLCPRTFIEKRKLELHLMAHKGEKPYICDKCGKGFMNSMNLKVHNRCHTGEKPYKCSFCDRTFNQQGSLIAHERHHKGERPYVCDICGDGYITKSQLTVHTRKHNNDRPYKCDQCDYAAYTGSLLKIHMVKHSDEKPFKCHLCPSAFKRQHHLEVHSKTHLTNVAKNEPENEVIIDVVIHKCPYCTECFGSEDQLTAHIDTHEIVVVTETTADPNDNIFIDQDGPDEVAYNIVLL